MYNRYIPSSQRPRSDGAERPRAEERPEGAFVFGQPWFRRLGESVHLFGGEAKNAGIAGILKGLGLDDLDSGDVLLLLILLLIFLEGDNTELVITLGLMLLLSGDGDQKE